MIQADRDPNATGTDPQYEVSARILELATDRFLACVALTAPGRSAIADEISQYGLARGLAFPPTILQEFDPDLAALQWLLSELDSSRQSILEGATHRAIQLLSSEVSFHRAVERSARRQVYNLAYGLTHEINNPLANIVARAQKLMGDVSDALMRKSLATMMDQGMRAHEMLAEVMRAVQPLSHPLAATDIVPIVREAWLNLQDRAREAGIRWDCHLNSNRIIADAHGASLLDALRMLGLNSIDACGPNDSAIWSCETVGSGSGEKVRITLSDTGPGLTPQAQRSAMDLFYSGREHGRGLGISLAIVHRIVEMHRGTFTVHSENGAGCRTEIELPQIRGPIESRPELSL